MNTSGRKLTSDAALPRGGRRFVGEVLRATPLVPGHENAIGDSIGNFTEDSKGNSKPVLDWWIQYEIAVARGSTTGDARDPAPRDLAGRPTNILSWQVE